MPRYTKGGRPRADRAAQFMPFAALTGYYELARRQERIREPRHEPTEEEAAALSRTMVQVRRGDLLRVTYHDGERYVTRAGVVRALEPAFRRLDLGGLQIAFDDITALERHPAGEARPAAR